jgi:hypothetical protein
MLLNNEILKNIFIKIENILKMFKIYIKYVVIMNYKHPIYVIWVIYE